MNKIYTHLIYLRKTADCFNEYRYRKVIQVPFSLTEDIYRFKSLMGKLENLTPRIADDSLGQILRRLDL